MSKSAFPVRGVIFWVLSILLTVGIAYFQRATGPTYPVSGEIVLDGKTIAYNFLRSYDVGSDAPVAVALPEGSNIRGYFIYRRYKSHDEWDTVPMELSNDTLWAFVPQQPAAGKVSYHVILSANDKRVSLEAEPVVLRYKGSVPAAYLIPHIIFMFLAMLFSARAGLEAIVKGRHTFRYTVLTLITLTVGGMILGPIIQKYAFGAYWTGWPVSNDLTDNKTLFTFIFWVIAVVVQWKNRKQKVWALIAAISLFAVYLIPHSVMGSELDFRELEQQDTIQTHPVSQTPNNGYHSPSGSPELAEPMQSSMPKREHPTIIQTA